MGNAILQSLTIAKKDIQQSIWIFFLVVLCFLSATALPLWKSVFLSIFQYAYLILLGSFIYFSRKDKIAFLLAVSYFLYFYQVPFVDLYSMEIPIPQYKIQIQDWVYQKTLIIYTWISLLMYGVIQVLLAMRIDIVHRVEKMRSHRLINILFWSAFGFMSLFIAMTLQKSGGLVNYLLLNKFEASRAQVFFLLDFKKFAVFTIIFGLLSRQKMINVLSYVLIIGLMGFELISAKRYLLLALMIVVYFVRFKQVKILYLPLVVFGVFVMTLFKYTYYGIRNYTLGLVNFSEIFYFEWKDVFYDTLLLSEAQGHILLLTHFIQYDINFAPSDLLRMLLTSLPFGHKLIYKYQSAGEFLRVYYNIEWGGLASAQYLVPYLSFGLFGVVFIYMLYTAITTSLLYLFKTNSLFLKVLVLANLPILLFYFHREELPVITKNLVLHATALFLVFCVAFLLIFLIQVFFSKEIKVYVE